MANAFKADNVDAERACCDSHTLASGGGVEEAAKYCADLIRSGDVPPRIINRTRSLWQSLRQHTRPDEHRPTKRPRLNDVVHRATYGLKDTRPQRMTEANLQFQDKERAAIRCLHFSPNGSTLAISCVHKDGKSGSSGVPSTVVLSDVSIYSEGKGYNCIVLIGS